ncbi:MAG: response regulator transcription factor [Elusimicrobia bacterium]|nr:response regulator transcription factor [Elusimicrobiota bacterium]
MRVAIVFDDPRLKGRCAKALELYGLGLAESRGWDAARRAYEAALGEGERTELFILDSLPRPELDAALAALRAHPVAAKARVLAVDETLDASGSAEVLDAGADDCYCKPFLGPVFSARARGLLRRAGWRADEAPARVLAFGRNLRLDLVDRLVTAGTAAAPLTRAQFDMLEALVRAPGNAAGASALAAALAAKGQALSPDHVEQELSGLAARIERLGVRLERDDGAFRLKDG